MTAARLTLRQHAASAFGARAGFRLKAARGETSCRVSGSSRVIRKKNYLDRQHLWSKRRGSRQARIGFLGQENSVPAPTVVQSIDTGVVRGTEPAKQIFLLTETYL